VSCLFCFLVLFSSLLRLSMTGLLLELMSSAIHPQLGSGNRLACAAYGKVLYTAWNDAQSEGASEGQASPLQCC
jgi:hypothetical protein